MKKLNKMYHKASGVIHCQSPSQEEQLTFNLFAHDGGLCA